MAVQPEICFETVENVLLKQEGREAYSDLFVTSERLVFSLLAKVGLPGDEPLISPNVAETASRALGTAVRSAGFVDWNAIRQGRESARGHAVGQRENLFGYSLRVRTSSIVSLLGDSIFTSDCIVAPKAEVLGLRAQHYTEPIPAFDSDGAGRVPKYSAGRPRSAWESPDLPEPKTDVGVIEITLAGRPPLLVVARESEQLMGRLERWMIGEPVKFGDDSQGLNEALPNPHDVFRWVEDPASFPDITEEVCERAANKDHFCRKIMLRLKSLPAAEREQFCHRLKERSPRLALSVGSMLAGSPGVDAVDGWTIVGLVLCFIAFVVAGINDWGFWTLAPVGFGVLTTAALARGIRSASFNKRLNSKYGAELCQSAPQGTRLGEAPVK
jgi:hypothetical protein